MARIKVSRLSLQTRGKSDEGELGELFVIERVAARQTKMVEEVELRAHRLNTDLFTLK